MYSKHVQHVSKNFVELAKKRCRVIFILFLEQRNIYSNTTDLRINFCEFTNHIYFELKNNLDIYF